MQAYVCWTVYAALSLVVGLSLQQQGSRATTLG